MKKLNRLLVAIADPRHPNAGVLRRAAALGRATGARLELFTAVTAPYTRRSPNGIADLQLTAEDSVRAVEQDLGRIARSKLLKDCRVQVCAEWDRPAHEAIIRRALQFRADLIISATHTRGLASRAFLRNTDWQLVRDAPMPLLLVKRTRHRPTAVVMAAIDPMHANAKPARLDERILDAAQGMAKLLKGTVHTFHAYLPLSISLAAELGETVTWDAAAMDAAQTLRESKALERTLRGSGIPTARRHLRAGPISGELADCAQRLRASLVVMGAVSRSRLNRLFIGNVAEQVLDELECDVLIVKPRGFKQPAVGRVKTRRARPRARAAEGARA